MMQKLLTLVFCGLAATHPAARAAEPNDQSIRFRVYASLTTGVSEERIRAVTAPVANLLGENLGHEFDYDFQEGRTLEDLLAFGKQLDDGEVHLGVLWGIEYGWLKQRFPKLEPLVVAAVSINLPHFSQLMVRKKDNRKTLEDVRGSTLARFRRVRLADALYQQKLCDDHGADFFKLEQAARRTTLEAMLAVRNGEADCVIVGVDLFHRLKATHPKVAEDLVVLVPSEPFPEPVVVGRRDRVEELEPGLWNRAQREFMNIHRTRRGEQLVFYMRRFQRFVEHSQVFEDLVEWALNEYGTQFESVGR